MPRRPGTKNIPWRSITARLRQKPNRWVLLPEMVDVHPSIPQRIRRRAIRALRLDDGHIVTQWKGGQTDLEGTVRGTVFLKFIPHDQEKS